MRVLFLLLLVACGSDDKKERVLKSCGAGIGTELLGVEKVCDEVKSEDELLQCASRVDLFREDARYVECQSLRPTGDPNPLKVQSEASVIDKNYFDKTQVLALQLEGLFQIEVEKVKPEAVNASKLCPMPLVLFNSLCWPLRVESRFIKKCGNYLQEFQKLIGESSCQIDLKMTGEMSLVDKSSFQKTIEVINALP